MKYRVELIEQYVAYVDIEAGSQAEAYEIAYSRYNENGVLLPETVDILDETIINVFCAEDSKKMQEYDARKCD